MSDYAGIDYGRGKTNIDPATGIRYGVISINALYPEAVEAFEPDYGEPTCPDCGSGLLNPSDETFREAFLSNWKDTNDDPDNLEAAEEELEDIYSDYYCLRCHEEVVSENAYGEEPNGFILDDGEYQAALDQYNDIMLFQSPYYTHAQFCSPCAPGAGHLGHPVAAGPKTYCLGHEWFEEDKAPYPVYRVADGTLVPPPAQA